MIAPDLLEILCCPETHQGLRLAAPQILERLNKSILAGEVKNRGGNPVRVSIAAGLIRADGKRLYPIRNNIPVLLVDEGIPLSEQDAL